MFFFIGGIQPRTKRISDDPRLCPSCGYYGAYLERVDHYLSLFFIPILPVKRGETVLICERCGRIFGEWGKAEETTGNARCRWCGQKLSEDFTFCPYCGKKIGL